MGECRVADTEVATARPAPDGPRFFRQLFALLAEIALNERETLRERIMSGLDEARRKGKTLGRPVGTGATTDEFLRKHSDIKRRLRKGLSIRETAAATGKGVSTVQRVKAVINSERARKGAIVSEDRHTWVERDESRVPNFSLEEAHDPRSNRFNDRDRRLPPNPADRRQGRWGSEERFLAIEPPPIQA